MTTYNDLVSEYITGLFGQEDEALRITREDLARHGLPAISIKPEEGRFLQFLTRVSGGLKAVEIGTLGGYSAIWIARGLAAGGKLVTLEKSSKHAEVARENLRRAGVAEQVEVRVGEAAHSLKKLAGEGPFDLCFIDADKGGYDAYLTWALDHVRPGGVVAAHNAFRGGKVFEAERDADTEAVRQTVERFAREPRLISTLYPAGDGLAFGVIAR